MTNTIYTASTGRCGTSFIAYALGLSNKIWSAHQPSINTHPLLWNQKDTELHKLGNIWLQNPNEFFSIKGEKVKEYPKLLQAIKLRKDWINKNCPKGKVYAESANSLFPLMHLYANESTKFIHLIREPKTWVKRNLPMYKPGSLKNRLDRNPSFVKGKTDIQQISWTWYYINAMIFDIAKRNPSNWMLITTNDFKNNATQTFKSLFDFLEIDSPKVDWEKISSSAGDTAKQPNKTFKNRPVQNSHQKERAWDKHYQQVFTDMSQVDKICYPLWKDINKYYS